jgi:hypothetical protein
MNPANTALLLAAALSALAALLHVAIIFGGPAWYRFFGAGERMAQSAARGERAPTIVTACIAAVLGGWSLYALSAAGAIPALPLLKVGIVSITAIYLLRGVLFVPAWLAGGRRLTPFVVWSSAICLVYGLIHLLGLVQVWPRL